ncbi:MAG TPA: family 20 glycosylhydrolase [Terriglobia bacterium]|nr:family 20 glycosylhydrolase [Terriglobia bacterium]
MIHYLRAPLLLLIASLAFIPIVKGQNSELNLMPQPAEVAVGEGRLVIDGGFTVALTGYTEPRLLRAAERLLARLSKQTGIPMSDVIAPDATKATLVIQCDHAGQKIQSVTEDESYTLDVNSQQAHLAASSPVGVLRGIETFLQLVNLDAQGFAAPAVKINDRPRFPWRGLMIDACRHWMPMDVIKRNLDGMAAVKLNVFHWHLSENQGFRVESKVFPKLTGMGSDGHFYTQDQVKEIIAYARDRGIRVIPEFDMPGHSTAWFVGYPELASAPGPYSIERHWGVFDPAMDPTNENVYKFLDKLIGEMAALFPDEYFHIGGDEVNGKQWDANPNIQAFMRAHGMKTNDELQTYFSTRVQALVTKHGKKTIGWDEVFHPGVPKDIVIQSWRGQESLAAAARQGYMGILSNGYYIDLMYPASQHYAVDPLEGATAGLTDEEKARILGGEATMWSEYVTPENVDSRIWPRTAAIAERFWSPQNVKDVDSMYKRLAVESLRLEWLGLKHRSYYPVMLERMADEHSAHLLKALADIVEPVKEYSRGRAHDYTSLSAYNRLVDAAHPESDVAREFMQQVNDWTNNKAQIQKQLAKWRDRSAEVAPLMQRSALLQEDAPLAPIVTSLATAGLQALEYLESGKPAPPSWLADQTTLLDDAAKPQGELLISIVPPIRKLVEMAAGSKP